MARLRVEVVYALAGRQDIVRCDLPPGATAGDAVAASGLAERYASEMEIDALRLGIGGKRVRHGQRLRDGDRVEILRTLAADPKEARRARASRGR